jgi:hypothetical protein
VRKRPVDSAKFNPFWKNVINVWASVKDDSSTAPRGNFVTANLAQWENKGWWSTGLIDFHS